MIGAQVSVQLARLSLEFKTACERSKTPMYRNGVITMITNLDCMIGLNMDLPRFGLDQEILTRFRR